MKKSFYKLLIKPTSWLLMGILSQFLLVGLSFAHDANPQKAVSIHEVVIETVYKNTSLADVFTDIESKTDFVFTYDKKDAFLKNKYSKPAGSTSVAALLRDVSLVAELIFQQINHNISVRKKTGGENADLTQVIINEMVNVTGTVTSSSDGQGIPGSMS